jgi:hypothetical protein
MYNWIFFRMQENYDHDEGLVNLNSSIKTRHSTSYTWVREGTYIISSFFTNSSHLILLFSDGYVILKFVKIGRQWWVPSFYWLLEYVRQTIQQQHTFFGRLHLKNYVFLSYLVFLICGIVLAAIPDHDGNGSKFLSMVISITLQLNVI